MHWGGKRRTYVIDLRNDVIYGDMPELSAEEPFTCIYAGRDVSDEVTTSPVEVGAIAFEDENGAVRIFLGNHLDKPRNVLVEFRGSTARVDMAAGELREVHPIGKPSDRRARAVPNSTSFLTTARHNQAPCSDPSNRFLTIVLAIGPAVLLLAIGIGERMGDRVLGQVDRAETAIGFRRRSIAGAHRVDGGPSARLEAFGYPYRRGATRVSPTLASLRSRCRRRRPDAQADSDPAPATPTPNPNIPIWRQRPLPTAIPDARGHPRSTVAGAERAQSETPSPAAANGCKMSPMSLLDALI